MAVNIHNLIAAIRPEVYCEEYIDDNGSKVNLREQVKEIAKEKGYLAAAAKAKLIEATVFDWNDIGYIKYDYRPSAFNPADKLGLKRAVQQYKLAYDSSSESLEALYYWIIDQVVITEFRTINKIVDNFISAPGSGHFSEMGAKATKMQEEGMKMLGSANTVIRSILNIIYDLKEFKLRLAVYDDMKSEDKDLKQAAMYSLKQIWMDSVDFKRGTTSLKGLVQQFDYVTIIDAFMTANTMDDLKSIDLNERVKRILQQRIAEFLRWIQESELELRKRFEVEKIYLRSQVNAVKLYARWAKPYLRWARQLEQNASPTAALVNTFNTTLMELTLFAERPYNPQEDIDKDDLPKIFSKEKMPELYKYVSVLIMELKYRSYPDRTNQGGYGFRGRIEILFTGYALREEELKRLKEEIEKDDIGDVLRLVEGATTESLDKIQNDIDEFLSDAPANKDGKKKDKKKNEDDTNPFSALFSSFQTEKKEENKVKTGIKIIRPDTDAEEIIRSQAVIEAKKRTRTFYNYYKKMHGMPSI